jgi:hypothetical protein
MMTPPLRYITASFPSDEKATSTGFLSVKGVLDPSGSLVMGSRGICSYGGAGGKLWYGEGMSSFGIELINGTVSVRRGSIVGEKIKTDLSPVSQIARSPVAEYDTAVG